MPRSRWVVSTETSEECRALGSGGDLAGRTWEIEELIWTGGAE